ncbi:hypothetical protein FDUTEX481_04559 [Tolypothrix sp. PCC 7601]|nr:hypothetical protein FDUTEX481_04559 [Tolypothrix sp. PCC 7601]
MDIFDCFLFLNSLVECNFIFTHCTNFCQFLVTLLGVTSFAFLFQNYFLDLVTTSLELTYLNSSQKKVG